MTNQLTINIIGTVTDSTAIQLAINGEELIVGGNGAFNYNLPIVEGLNTITIVATDTVGNQTTVTRIVRRDTQVPIVNVTSPTDSLVTNQQTVNITGTITDSTAVQLTVNGNPVTIGTGGAFSTQVTLAEGINTIAIVATDAAGNQTTITRTVTRDTESPIVTLISPIDSLITNQSNITVSGTVTNPSGMTLTVNENPTTIETDGTFSTSVGLNEGLNAVILVVTDQANNQTTITRTIRRDTQSPVITITSPIDSLLTNQQTLNVSGTVIDSTTVQLTVNSDVLTVGENGAFSTVLTLTEGMDTVKVTATDAAGNTSTVTRIVMLDTTPPVLTITSPANGTTTSENTIQVSGIVTDLTDITLTINGTTVSVNTDGSFNATVSLVAGPNTITIVAVDYLEQTTTITRTVTMEGQLLPPDPVTVAPKLDPTIATNMFNATEFLYAGENPIQTGVAPGTIDAVQVAVLRGKVLKRDLSPLSGVKITIPNHPEYGYTFTRLDGMFDMAVNGGGPVTIDYQKTGYLPVQRQLFTNWHDYSIADSVVMIQLDTAVTRIDFTEPTQTAKGSIMTDASGSRQAVLLFSQGTKAQMLLPDSTTQDLDVIHVRATEYTVGPTGRAAMPAELPSKMRYTYCVELSADEAVAANALSVKFDKPVHFFVDNFLNFPVGGIVPVGWYDRQNKMWVPSRNAYIMQVIGIQDSSALIDLNGDGENDNEFLSDSLNFSANDFKTVAVTYSIGSSFWCAEVNHFSAYDCNGQLANKSKDKSPNGDDPDDPDIPCENEGPGSIIFIQSQTLCETLPLSGTPFNLWYESDRSKDREQVVEISLSGETLPSGLKRIELYAQVAGRFFKQSFSPSEYLTTLFEWDGIDAYGRTITGRQKVTFQIAFIYDISYIIAELGNTIDNCWNYEQIRSWWDEFQIQYIGNEPMSYKMVDVYDNTRSECSFLSPISTEYIGKWTANNSEVAGWTLNVHHTYEPESRTLRRGDGGRVSLEVMSPTISTVIGSSDGGASAAASMVKTNNEKSFVPAINFSISKNKNFNINADMQNIVGVPDSIESMTSVTIDKDGTIYAADGDAAVYKILKDGTQLRIAGTGEWGFNGLSGIATDIQLDSPSSVKVDDEGNVYIADSWNNRVCKVTPDGYLTTIAGNGEMGFSGNGGPAINAKLNYPAGIAIGPDKNIYISDCDNNLIRCIRPDGIIYTAAGIDSLAGISYGYYDGGDGVPSTETMLNCPMGLTVDPVGNVFFADMCNNTVRVIRPTGTIETYAGHPDSSSTGDGGPAKYASLDYPMDVAIGKDGGLFIADTYNNLIRRVSPGGIITTYAGGGNESNTGDGVTALSASLYFPLTVAIGADGSVYTVTGISHSRLCKIATILPGFSNDKLYIPSEDAKTLYTFDLTGRHLTTTSTITGKLIYTFGYDSSSCLSTITDIDSLVTRIIRDDNGSPVEIISPFGQKTFCTVDSTGCLESIRNEANETTQMTYSSGGLLKTFRNPKGGVHQFTYDSGGRLIKDEDPAGGYSILTRTKYSNDDAKGFKVELKTSEGRTSTYRAEIINENGGTRFFNTDENNCSSSVSMEPGQRRIHKSDGTYIYTTYKPDPRFGLLAPLFDVEVITPDGLKSYVEQNRIITEITGTATTGYMDSILFNNKIFKTIYSGNQGLITKISPEGRTSFSWINPKGRIIKDSIPGVESVKYSYDSQGRLVNISQAGRIVSYSYNEKSYLASITVPTKRVSRFEYDSVGRIAMLSLPDSNQISYSYDANGNLITLTPPGRPVYTFDYTVTDLAQKYLPPVVGGDTMATTYLYNLDKMLQRIMRPDSGAIALTYDTTIYGYVWHYGPPGWLETLKRPNNRMSSITFDRGDLKFDYDSSGNLHNLISPAGDTLRYTYDGSLVKSVSWIGEVNGIIGTRYNEDYQIVSQTINGIDSVQYKYNNDGLLTQVGYMNITREQATGRVSGTTLGNLTTSQSYNSLGELSGYQANYGGSPIFQTSYQRDSLRRITQINEIVQGISEKKNYAYDIAGRLWKVWRNDTLISTYTYDPNGNRIAHITPTSVDSGAYDLQDRMLKYGNTQYIYSKNGELQKKIEGVDTTHYTYDYFGNLTTVQLPNGDRIDYIIDGQNRRIGKKVNGMIVNRWIYSGKLLPIAELDSIGEVVARFIGCYMIKDGIAYQLVTDRLGSVRLVINTNTGSIVQKIDYDEYGNVLNDSNPDFQPFGYARGLYDQHTKLVRLGARDYDNVTGRWTAADRIKFRKGSSNLYIYCHSDPINFIDIDGFHEIYTSKGRKIEHMHEEKVALIIDDKTGYLPPLSEEHDYLNDQPELSKGLIKTGPAGTYQNCHGFAYQPDDDVWINDPTVKIEDDCDPVPKSDARPGDRVTWWYYNTEDEKWEPYHSGVVYDCDGGIESKFGYDGRYLGWGSTTEDYYRALEGYDLKECYYRMR